MIKELSILLDADWERLCLMSFSSSRPRRIFDSFNPRFAPVFFIRIAQSFYLSGWIRTSKFVSFINFFIFGIEVTPRMNIGPGLILMHTHGTVLGAASIGNNVTIYQQVTLGAAVFDFSYSSSLRPVVDDNVVIGAGAKVLGCLTLGQGCKIGANAVVLNSVPPEYTAVGVPVKLLPPTNKIVNDQCGI